MATKHRNIFFFSIQFFFFLLSSPGLRKNKIPYFLLTTYKLLISSKLEGTRQAGVHLSKPLKRSTVQHLQKKLHQRLDHCVPIRPAVHTENIKVKCKGINTLIFMTKKSIILMFPSLVLLRKIK